MNDADGVVAVVREREVVAMKDSDAAAVLAEEAVQPEED
jgi:hypothetical protein